MEIAVVPGRPLERSDHHVLHGVVGRVRVVHEIAREPAQEARLLEQELVRDGAAGIVLGHAKGIPGTAPEDDGFSQKSVRLRMQR